MSLQLPALTAADIAETIARLPLVAPPAIGQEVDGFALKALVSEGRYSRLFAASDLVEGGDVVVKFPKPQTASAEDASPGILARAMGGKHGAESLGGPGDRTGAGAPKLSLHRDAAL